jgi:hypothetical protein
VRSWNGVVRIMPWWPFRVSVRVRVVPWVRARYP